MGDRAFQEFLSVQSRHTAAAGCRNRLAILLILYVAASEHAGNVRFGRAWLHENITVIIRRNLAAEEFRVRRMADRYEDTIRFDYFLLSRFIIANLQACNAIWSSDNFNRRAIEGKADFFVLTSAILHDFGGAHFFTTVNQLYILSRSESGSLLLP